MLGYDQRSNEIPNCWQLNHSTQVLSSLPTEQAIVTPPFMINDQMDCRRLAISNLTPILESPAD